MDEQRKGEETIKLCDIDELEGGHSWILSLDMLKTTAKDPLY